MAYDAATEKRKRMFADSLKKLMRQKSFSKITVTELVRDCGVNRKTFYYHFEDIYDLLKWMLEQEVMEVVKNFDLMVNAEDAISFVLDYVSDNHHILSCAYDAIGRTELRQFFYADFIEVLASVIDRAEEELGLRADPRFKQFLADFYAEAFAGMLINLFRGDVDYSRDEILQNIILILKVTIPELLGAGRLIRS